MAALKSQVYIGIVHSTDASTIDVEAKSLRHVPDLRRKHTYADVVGVYAYSIGTDGTISAMIYVTREELDTASQNSPRVWAAYPEHSAMALACARLEAA